MTSTHHVPLCVKTKTINIIPVNAQSKQLWGLWEWNSTFGQGKETQALIYGSNEDLVGFEGLKAALKTEIERIHREVEEDTCAYENFQRGPIGTVGDHILYDFPDEATAPDTFEVMISQNGPDTKYGLIAYKAGKQPDHPPGF